MRTSRIIKQHLKGKTNAEIAAALDCDISIVIKAIHEYDIAD
jgi:transposase